jgi:hypothetical protein
LRFRASSLLKKLFQLLFLLFAGLHLSGGPYAIVQVYAWGNMLAEYSKESGFVQGAKDTFGGEKPCRLCCKIAAAKKADAESGKPEAPAAPSQVTKAPDYLPSTHGLPVPPAGTKAPPVMFGRPVILSGIGMNSPPTPPPRTVA